MRTPTCGECSKASSAQMIGALRGGLPTKIHAAVDDRGNSVRMTLNADPADNLTKVKALIASFMTDTVRCDKGYYSDAYAVKIETQCDQAIIPPLSNRTEQRSVGLSYAKIANLLSDSSTTSSNFVMSRHNMASSIKIFPLRRTDLLSCLAASIENAL